MGTREEVVKFIRSCVISTKEKLSLRQLNKDYKLLMGEWIPFQRLGFASLEELIQSSSELILSRMGGEVYVRAKTSEKSVHMAELISNQKTAKRKPRKVRFSRHPSPPRMHQTSRWRPKSQFQSNKYTSSKRPEAVSHSQFVNKSPVAAKAPPVASKVVIPEHSSYSSKHSQQIAPTPAVRRTELNQRLTSSRIQENMKALENNNAQNGFDYTVNHNGTSLPSSDPIANDSNTSKIKSFLLDLNDNSTDPLMSTRKRLNKKISELSLDRDSGNSSPTHDVSPPSPIKTPEFVRTLDPLADLKNFARIHKLGEVIVGITQVNPKRQKFYSCKIKVGQKHTYTSYPEEFRNPLEAQTFCCEQALTDLVPKYKRKSLMISSESDILARIPPMLEKHNHGIWAWQLKLDYADTYREWLSDDWLKIIDSSPCVHIEKMSEDYILYHCRPGDKGQQRGAGSIVPLANVSVPANTVQFGDDGRLVGVVTSVISANEIWCEQVGTEESNRFAEMFDRMQIYYQEHEKQLVPETILPAGYYMAKCDGVYYRVRAVKISDEEVDCFFIDCGDEMAVSKTDMFVVKRVYATSQAQAFVCRLVGLEDLYDFPANSQFLASRLQDKTVILELATDVTNNDNSMVLPVIMYDVDTGCSINEELISALTMELATPHLQPEGITEVYVSHIESNGDVYVQVRTQGYDNLQLLRSQIEELVTTKPPEEILYKVNKSNSRQKLYFMEHKRDGCSIWYRVKLIDWSPDGELAQVYFVDEGFTHVIRVAAETLYPLEMLNDVFNNYPYQAIRVRMALDLIPPDFVDLASKSMPKESPVLLKIVGATEDNFPLVKLFKRNSDGGLFCINESIALHSELNSKKEDKAVTKLMFSQLTGLDNVPSTGTLKCPPLPKAGDDTFFKVHIPVAVNPYNFFVQPFDSRPELDAMMERLQERYKDVKYGNLKVEDVLPGSIYASKHDDGFWYRTSVIKVIHSGASVSVFYCDFGYYQTLPVKQLIPLDDEFMTLPYQALKAKLGDIKPKQNKWTMEDCEQFKILVESKLLFAKLVDIEKDILYESDLVLKLLLIDTSSDDDIIISHELVRRGIAVEEAE